MDIKLVTKSEINSVMSIIDDAIILLGKSSLQWQQGYPNEDTMLLDIKNKNLFGAYLSNQLVGVVALIKGINENYLEIDGKWLTPSQESDLVIHRIAVKNGYHHQKVGQALMEYAEKYAKENNCKSVKIDTHKSNIPMQKLITNNQYKYAGIIYIKSEKLDNARLAYEKEIN